MFCSLKERSKRDGFIGCLGQTVDSRLIDDRLLRPLNFITHCWKARHAFSRLCDCHTSQSISNLWNPRKKPVPFYILPKDCQGNVLGSSSRWVIRESGSEYPTSDRGTPSCGTFAGSQQCRKTNKGQLTRLLRKAQVQYSFDSN